MACQHKFFNDLQLQYVDWEVRTLFIGTFNPSWNVCDNDAEWFYGRVQRNGFWCILPTIHEGVSMIDGDRNTWIDFCRRNHLAITDILSSLDNADETNPNHQRIVCKYKDDDLEEFDSTLNDIPLILEQHTSIKQICISRQTLPEFWEDCFIDTFMWQQNNPDRNLQFRFLRSPSRGARRGVVGNFCDFNANRWIEQGYQCL